MTERGSLTELIQVKVTPELDEKVVQLAQFWGITKAEVIRRLIDRAEVMDVMPYVYRTLELAIAGESALDAAVVDDVRAELRALRAKLAKQGGGDE